MAEAVDDLLHVSLKDSNRLNSLLSFDNTRFARGKAFEPRYENDTHQNFNCMPKIDFEYNFFCNPEYNPDFYSGDNFEGTYANYGDGLMGEDGQGDECMLKRGCCEDIANHDEFNAYVPLS